MRNITGETGLWELRVEGERRIFRFFFGCAKHRIVLLHAVVKKSRRLSPRDIRLAAEQLKWWREALKDEHV